jgi:hypothetical protein
MLQISSTSHAYRELIFKCLFYDKAKSDFLLALQLDTYSNQVDNILTKDSYSYIQIKNKFLPSTSGYPTTEKYGLSIHRPPTTTTITIFFSISTTCWDSTYQPKCSWYTKDSLISLN